MQFSRLIFVILLFSSGALSAESNWPQFRGPRGDGHSQATDLPHLWSETENITWKTPIHGRGWSSPVIWDNQIWMTTATADGKEMFAICVNGETGKIIHDRKLFDVEKPRPIHLLNSYASPTPVIEKGRVYLNFGSYGTACLDTKTGESIWERRDLPCNHFRGPGSSPILFENLLIMHYDGFDFQYIVALDKKTGDTVWKKDRDVDYGTNDGDIMKAYNTPLVIRADDRLQLISPTSKAAISYNPHTGDEIWKVRYTGFSSTARPLFGLGLVFINSGFSKAELLAVRPDGTGDITDSHVAWHIKKSIPSKTSHLLIDDLIYMIHDAGIALCVDARTGETVWQKRIGGKFSSSTLYADGKIYFFSQEGITHVLKPGPEFQLLAKNRLDTEFMASPAITGKALILRGLNHLYRIEK